MSPTCRVTCCAGKRAMQVENLPDGVNRTSALFGLLDSVFVTKPEIIRQIDACEDIARPDEESRHPMLTAFFNFTKFYSAIEKQYFVGFLDDDKKDQQERTKSMRDLLQTNFSAEQANALKELVQGSGTSLEITRHLLQHLSTVFLNLQDGEQVPDRIVEVAADTLVDTAQVGNPVAVWRALRARKAVEKYVAEHIAEGVSVTDVAHNFGAVAQGASRALLLLRGNEEVEIKDLMLASPVQTKTVRVPLRETTVNGLFPADQPLIPGKTIITLDIGSAATKTGDDAFLFGAGTEHRQCPFKNVLYSLSKDMAE